MITDSNHIPEKPDIFQDIRCIVCGNKNKETFHVLYEKDTCSVVRCEQCSFQFIPPFFRKGIDYSNYKSSEVAREVARGDVWLKIERNLLRYRLIQKFKKSGTVYDIGCGFGHFLVAGKKLGYSVAGVEMSSANVDFIRNEFDITVEKNSFLEVAESQAYDIITLWDVLEHIDSADLIVQKVSRMLNPGGLVFIQVPQIDSFFARLLKDKWWAMGLDHVNYFSKKTIRQLLANYGFEVKTIHSSIELKNILTYVILPKLRRRKKTGENWTNAERQQEFNRLTRRPQWLLWLLVKSHNLAYKTLSRLHIGDEMIVVAQKITESPGRTGRTQI